MIMEHEAQQVERANATNAQPVVFVHGLWLLPSSCDRWAKVFEDAGYTALTPGWPDDPESVGEANAKPETFAHVAIKIISRTSAASQRRFEQEARGTAVSHSRIVKRAVDLAHAAGTQRGEHLVMS